MSTDIKQDISAIIGNEEDYQDIVRSPKDNAVCALASAGALACSAAFYFSKAAGQPWWLAALEGALGVTFLMVASHSQGNSPTFKEALSNAVVPMTEKLAITLAVAATCGYMAGTDQHETNVRNSKPPIEVDPDRVFSRKGQEFILSWEACEGKKAGDRVDVSKYFFDKTHWYFTICPK